MPRRSAVAGGPVVMAIAIYCSAACGFLTFDEPELPAAATTPVDFSRDIQPLFSATCFRCHGPQRQRGGLRLDRSADGLRGGDTGSVIVTGKSAESPLIHHLTGTEGAARMPPDADPFTPTQIGIIRRWIDDGAVWPEETDSPGSDSPGTDTPGTPSTDPAGDADGSSKSGENAATRAANWWSLKPLVRPAVPDAVCELEQRLRSEMSASVSPAAARERDAAVAAVIDGFIDARLQAAGLSRNPRADKRTLIRRVYQDLHGLPPSPADVDAFLVDESPTAYADLIDRLLADSAYGERWARHWLDIAHYADSHGHDQDRPRPNAWPYRDYLIRAFNSDIPYGQFVRQQIAGDVIWPESQDALIATGFLACGPWDESALRDIRDDGPDRLIGQLLDRDDIVTSVMSTFTGMTVGCARCHDHKFDPIPQTDYYALQAVFAGIDKAERAFDTLPEVAAARNALKIELDRIRSDESAVMFATATPELRNAFLASVETVDSSAGGWTTLVPAKVTSRDAAILRVLQDRSVLVLGDRPEKDEYTITAGCTLTTISAIRLEVLADELLPFKGPGRQDNGNLHLSEVTIATQQSGSPATAKTVIIKSAVADFDQAGWGAAKTIDGDVTTAWGIYPEVGKSHAIVFEFESPIQLETGHELVIHLRQEHGGGHLIGRFRLMATQQPGPFPAPRPPGDESIEKLRAIPLADRTPADYAGPFRDYLLRHYETQLAVLPPQQRVYCGTNKFDIDGSFKPTAKPRPVSVLARGDINRPISLAAPGALSAIAAVNNPFPDAENSDESARRLAMAEWLADTLNPLTWRVIVNRVWGYHFGTAIADTPNDFGRMGGTPSHPELLDWLAAEFRDGPGQLKSLHRQILLSESYQQSSQSNPAAMQVDAGNRLLWRMNRQRLDAESYRDAILTVSGQLNRQMSGPPVMHFMMSPGVHVTPNADYTTFDPSAPDARRRSIYRFIFRTRPDPFLETLDCPDASQSAPVRGSTVGPLQALSLWNNRLTLHAAAQMASSVAENRPMIAEQVSEACRRVLNRRPTATEQTAWCKYAETHGMANFCRLLLNSSEFLFID